MTELNTSISLPKNSCVHCALDGKICLGTQFTFIARGVGGLCDELECESCHRVLQSYGDHILDPLAEAVLDLSDEANIVAAVKISYRYRHGKENGTTELPVRWFEKARKADEFFTGITEKGAVKVWPRYASDDTLDSVEIKLLTKGEGEWGTIRRKEYKL